MKYLRLLKVGDKESPAFLIILYYLLFTLDLITTYLASPDLRYEGNWIFNYIKFSFLQFSIFYFALILLVTLGYLIALNYLHTYFNENVNSKRIILSSRELINLKVILSFIMLGCFYSHILNLGHIIINNFLGLIYIFKIENFLSEVSFKYVSNQTFFHLYIQTIPILIGYGFAIYKLKQIRNKYKSLPN